MIERPLDTVEHVFALLAEVDACDGVVVLAVEGELSEERCRAAVRALPARHPRLATHVVADGEARRFVAEGTAPLPFVVSPPSDRAAWPEIVAAEMRTALDPHALFRIRLVPASGSGPHALVVHGHHAAADFLSMARVGHDVCAIAGGAEVTAVPPGLPLDRRLPDGWVAPTEADGDVAMLPFRSRASRRERAPRVAFRTLPAPTLEGLLARARREEATLAGLLTVVASDALAAWPDARWDHRGVRVATSVGARRLCTPPVPEEELGCFVSLLETVVRLDGTQEPPWPRAREATRTTRERVSRGEWQAPLRAVRGRLPGFARRLEASVSDDAGQGRDTVLDVVSFGALTFPALPSMRVTEIYGAVSQRGFGNCLQLSCGTWDRVLCCSLGWTAPLVSDADAEAYFDRVMTALERAA